MSEREAIGAVATCGCVAGAWAAARRRDMRPRALTAIVACCVLAAAFSARPFTWPSAPRPAAAQTPTESTIGAKCTVSGGATPTGSAIISQAMVPAITGSSLPLSLPASVEATGQINPGGTVHYRTTLTADTRTSRARRNSPSPGMRSTVERPHRARSI